MFDERERQPGRVGGRDLDDPPLLQPGCPPVHHRRLRGLLARQHPDLDGGGLNTNAR